MDSAGTRKTDGGRIPRSISQLLETTHRLNQLVSKRPVKTVSHDEMQCTGKAWSCLSNLNDGVSIHVIC